MGRTRTGHSQKRSVGIESATYTFAVAPNPWHVAEACVAARGDHPCIAAPLYEWGWVAILVGVALFGLYVQYKIGKLSRLAKKLGLTMGDAAVGASSYADWWLLRIRIDAIVETPSPPEDPPPLCDSP